MLGWREGAHDKFVILGVNTVEHIYDACPKYSELGNFRIIFMLATVPAADSASTLRKKYSVFIHSEAEPHAMYAIYINRR